MIENVKLSYGCNNDGITDNMLIHGDNLLALKALEKNYAAKIKYIYIDPPFNTGQAFEHYDDKMEMSFWLDLMRSRLQIIHFLLSAEGTLFVHIDDVYLPYLTILLDEIFGRIMGIGMSRILWWKQKMLYLVEVKGEDNPILQSSF